MESFFYSTNLEIMSCEFMNMSFAKLLTLDATLSQDFIIFAFQMFDIDTVIGDYSHR